MRIIATIVVLLGLASVVLGVLLIVEAGSGQDEIKESIAPLLISEVEAKYDAVVAQHNAMKAAEEPLIQTGKAAPSAMYNYLSAQRASLGLAKANIGTVKSVRMNGIVDIVVGAGLVLAGMGLFRKASD